MIFGDGGRPRIAHRTLVLCMRYNTPTTHQPGGISWRVIEVTTDNSRRLVGGYETYDDFQALDASSPISIWSKIIDCLKNLNRELSMNLFAELDEDGDDEDDEDPPVEGQYYRCVRPWPNSDAGKKAYMTNCCEKSADGNMSWQQCYDKCRAEDSAPVSSNEWVPEDPEDAEVLAVFKWHDGSIKRQIVTLGERVWDTASKLSERAVKGVYVMDPMFLAEDDGAPLGKLDTFAKYDDHFFVDCTMERHEMVNELVYEIKEYGGDGKRYIRYLKKKMPLAKMLEPFIPKHEMTTLEWNRATTKKRFYTHDMSEMEKHLENCVVKALIEQPCMRDFRQYYEESILRSEFIQPVLDNSDDDQHLNDISKEVCRKLTEDEEDNGEDILDELLTNDEYLDWWSPWICEDIVDLSWIESLPLYIWSPWTGSLPHYPKGRLHVGLLYRGSPEEAVFPERDNHYLMCVYSKELTTISAKDCL